MPNWALRNLQKNMLPPIPKEECSHTGHMTYADMNCWCNKCGQKWRRFPPEEGEEIGTMWITEQTLKAAAEAKKRKERGRRNR